MPSPRCPVALVGLLALGVAALLVLPGCGCHDCGGVYVPPGPYLGDVYLDNLTDLGPAPEFAETFYLAPAGTVGFTGNLLPGPLAPGATQFVGTYAEGYWDAEADMEFGDLVTWFDTYVAAFDDTFFEVY